MCQTTVEEGGMHRPYLESLSKSWGFRPGLLDSSLQAFAHYVREVLGEGERDGLTPMRETLAPRQTLKKSSEICTY